jgi:pantoate kinase
MAEAFCPGHITCFFRSARIPGDLLRSGSAGAGFCLDKGALARAEDANGYENTILFHGQESEAPVTRRALGILGCHGLRIDIRHQLPLSQGMGMSAAGSIAACLAAAELCGLPRRSAFEAAHRAEIETGGGLGDVSALMGHGQSTRVSPGLPPYGEVRSRDWELELSLVVLGPKISTASIILDPGVMGCIDECGGRCLDRYLAQPTLDRLFQLSNRFSHHCRLENEAVRGAMNIVRPFARSGMAMLGNAIFMHGDLEAAESALGMTGIRVHLDPQGARVTRKG